MRVMLLDVNYDYSSTGKIVRDLHLGLESNGHLVSCLYGRGIKTNTINVKKISSIIEVGFHAALTRITGLTGIFSPFATKKLIYEIERFKPDLIHFHELHGYYINIFQIINYVKLNKIPVLWTFHCEFMYTGKCGHALECNRWQDKCGNCPQLKKYPKSLVFDQTSFMLDQKKEIFKNWDQFGIVAPSNWLARRIGYSFLGSKDVKTIYNGIDMSVFYPRSKKELRIKHGLKTKYVLLAIAPSLLSDDKGGKWILELASRLIHEDITFIMIGVDNPNLISAPNIIAHSKIKDLDLIAEFYSLSDFTLLTSRKETFSLVCAESLACGTPIIGFDAGAPSEVAPPGFGCFVKYGNIVKLHHTVMESLTNTSDFMHPSECFTFVNNNYSKEQMIDRYISEYKDLLKK